MGAAGLTKPPFLFQMAVAAAGSVLLGPIQLAAAAGGPMMIVERGVLAVGAMMVGVMTGGVAGWGDALLELQLLVSLPPLTAILHH